MGREPKKTHWLSVAIAIAVFYVLSFGPALRMFGGEPPLMIYGPLNWLGENGHIPSFYQAYLELWLPPHRID
jgi:hypothetical protein